MWKIAKLICPFFADSRKPMSLSACSVDDNRPACTSIIVTQASEPDSVSKFSSGRQPK
jgi:hypothetical protein